MKERSMPTRPVKIVVIGGGSSYTPEIIEGLLARRAQLPVREVWLTDIPAGKEKLDIITGLARRMVAKFGDPFPVHATLRRGEALDGADFVLTQLRVGMLDARVRDERIPMRYGAIGQETVGAGGFAKALRTIPVILDICHDVERACPDAFLINFTNPAGIVTEAASLHSRAKVIGLCNNPINMQNWVAEQFGVTRREVAIEFVGCNHLVWGKRVFVEGRDVTRKALEKLAGDTTMNMKNIPDHAWPRELVQSLGAFPNPYHKYYYMHDVMLAEMLEKYRAGKPTRGEEVKRVEAELFKKYQDPTLDVKPPELAQRGGALYSEAAVQVIDSIVNDRGDAQCVDTLNRGALLDLPENVVVEVTCAITAHGPVPLTVGRLPPQILGLLQLMKAFEALTIRAAVHGDKDAALQALTMNPLVPSIGIAQQILDDILVENSEYLPQFAQ
jgi:6-phospho-beta-glucosidase